MPSLSGDAAPTVQPVPGTLPRRPAFRPPANWSPKSWSPPSLIVGTIVATLLLLAFVLTVREIIISDSIDPGTATASAAFTMPDVQGMTFAAAIDSLSQQGIAVDRVEIVYGPGPTNQVVAQDPVSGTSVDDNESVTLIVRTDR